MSVAMPRVMTRGVVFVHSTPTALCPHITWALESVFGQRLNIDWTRQPAGAALVRAEFSWAGEAGTGAKIASSLRGWDNLRYEVTEEPSAGSDGSRWSHTPRLGIHHTWSRRRGTPSSTRTACARSSASLRARPTPWPTCSTSSSAPSGTPSSSPSGMPATGRRCAGCTRWVRFDPAGALG